jgi:hypothetical protein
MFHTDWHLSKPAWGVKWQIDRHAHLRANYGILYASQLLKEASPG